jgi:hypothetical protein
LALRSDEPLADSLEISRFLPSFLGKMAVFDETEPLLKKDVKKMVVIEQVLN